MVKYIITTLAGIVLFFGGYGAGNDKGYREGYKQGWTEGQRKLSKAVMGIFEERFRKDK